MSEVEDARAEIRASSREQLMRQHRVYLVILAEDADIPVGKDADKCDIVDRLISGARASTPVRVPLQLQHLEVRDGAIIE